MTATPQKANEGSSKRPVEYRIDNRVDRGRDVAQPEAGVHHVVRHRAISTSREQNVQHKKRRPA